MKTITCRAMGGECDEPITGTTPEELMANGMKHLEKAHPKMAADVKKMPKDDPMMKKWSEDFMKTWAGTPDM
ncbi:MAG: DUF1059 domain-containing protein [Candidatus Pacebacteria bacterium]|nr:DUF1059 domain-containing protein [Candidatus Paceibacterota bacterium]